MITTEYHHPYACRRKLPEVALSYLENLSEPGYYVPGILAAISRAKDELRTPAEFENLAKRWLEATESAQERVKATEALEAAKVYAAYQEWLAEGGYVDYGDLVRLGLEVLKHPGAGDEIRGKYAQILVDEFQDINYASGRLLRALDGGRGVVWAVADPDQSIYGFRGASAANLERFGDDYPGYSPIYLTKNYRSSPDIVGACAGLRGLIKKGEGGSALPFLESTRSTPKAPGVTLLVAPDEDAELEYISKEIYRRNKNGVPLGDQAVLCATNGQARKVVAHLTTEGLEALGPTTLLGSGEIKNVLAIISLLRGGDGAALLTVGTLEENPLTEQDVMKVLGWAKEQRCSVREAISRASEIEGLNEDASSSLTELAFLLDQLPAWRDAWHAVLAYVFHPQSRVRELFYDSSREARGRLSQLGQLAVLARSFTERKGLVEGEGIPGFMEYMAELAASEKGDSALYAPRARDAVQVMTVHKSKGLEFPVVYVPNLVTRRFPGGRGGGGNITLPPNFACDEHLRNADEELRCLFYVALTRAEDELVLTRAERYGNKATALPLIDCLVREFDGRTILAEHQFVSEGQPGMMRSGYGSGIEGGIRGQPKSAYSFRELQRYGDCSLQYKFRELLGLPERDSAYRVFHNCLYRVLGEMEVEARETGRNPLESTTIEILVRVWEEEGPDEHFYGPVYRARAQEIVENWQRTEGSLNWQVRQKLSLPVASGPKLEITADAVQQDKDGTIVVARHMFGRPRQSHTSGKQLDRFSLYIAAARDTWPGKPIKGVLHYLSSGEIVEVPLTEKIISNRTEKLAQNIEGIQAGRYPPNPGLVCKKCSWNLICPASV